MTTDFCDLKRASPSKRPPPYVAFSTLVGVVASFKALGLPDRIDRSVLTDLSPHTAHQLRSALRALDLVDRAFVPTERLAEVTQAFGSSRWPDALRELLQDTYPTLLELDLSKATPSQFLERLSESCTADSDTLRKCATFFLNAATEAQLSISPYLLVGTRQRRQSRGGGIRRQRHGKTLDASKAEKLLIELLDPGLMSETEQHAVFTLLTYVKRRSRDVPA